MSLRGSKSGIQNRTVSVLPFITIIMHVLSVNLIVFTDNISSFSAHRVPHVVHAYNDAHRGH